MELTWHGIDLAWNWHALAWNFVGLAWNWHGARTKFHGIGMELVGICIEFDLLAWNFIGLEWNWHGAPDLAWVYHWPVLTRSSVILIRLQLSPVLPRTCSIRFGAIPNVLICEYLNPPSGV